MHIQTVAFSGGCKLLQNRRSINELVKAAKKGCEESFDELYSTYCEELVKAEMEANLSYSPDLIEGACKDAREKAKESLSRYREFQSEYIDYVLGIAKNVRAEIHIQNAKSGNEEAKGALQELAPDIKKYIKIILRSKYIILGDGEIDEFADDIYQEAFEKLLKSLQKYEERGKFYSYYRKIVQRTIFDLMKKHIKQVVIKEEENKKQAGDAAHEELGFEDKISYKELADKLCSDLLTLVVGKGGYPHQVISFLYSVIIYPVEEDSQVRKGLPGVVAKKMGNDKLRDLHFGLTKRYPIGEPKNNDKAFRILEEKMAITTEEIIGKKELDTFTWRVLEEKQLLKEKVGSTCLYDYCDVTNINKENEKITLLSKQISEWSYKVKDKVRKYIFENPETGIAYEDSVGAYSMLKANDSTPYAYLVKRRRKSGERYKKSGFTHGHSDEENKCYDSAEMEIFLQGSEDQESSTTFFDHLLICSSCSKKFKTLKERKNPRIGGSQDY